MQLTRGVWSPSWRMTHLKSKINWGRGRRAQGDLLYRRSSKLNKNFFWWWWALTFLRFDPPRIPCDPDTVLEVVVMLAWPTASTTAAPTALDTERLLILATSRSNDALQVEVAVPQTELAEVNEAASILQHLTLNRQTAFQNQIQTILGKTFQFYEKPPPRLFFILPTAVRRMETIVKFVPQDFRLYFLCECGEHTARTGSSEMDRVHLTNHHGYDIARPEALPQSFGPHILAVMRGVRSGTKTVSVVIPPLVSSDMVQKLNDAEVAVGRTWVENEPPTQESVQNMVERTISYLEDMRIRQAVRGQPSNSPELMNTGSIEKADSELLRSFLRVPYEDKSLANLYRMKDSGHIKLVCQSHFRQKHPKQTPERLLNLMKKVVDTFSEREGRVHMSLKDEAEANAFYSALTETRGVQELHVSLEWCASRSEFQAFADAAIHSGVVALTFQNYYFPFVRHHRGQQRYEPLIKLLAKAQIQVATIYLNDDLFGQISGLSTINSFPTLRDLEIMQVQEERNHDLFLVMIGKCTALQRLSIRVPEKHWPRDASLLP